VLWVGLRLAINLLDTWIFSLVRRTPSVLFLARGQRGNPSVFLRYSRLPVCHIASVDDSMLLAIKTWI
jgi:hypothetical protein